MVDLHYGDVTFSKRCPLSDDIDILLLRPIENAYNWQTAQDKGLITVDLHYGGVTFGMRRHLAGKIDIPPLRPI